MRQVTKPRRVRVFFWLGAVAGTTSEKAKKGLYGLVAKMQDPSREVVFLHLVLGSIA